MGNVFLGSPLIKIEKNYLKVGVSSIAIANKRTNGTSSLWLVTQAA